MKLRGHFGYGLSVCIRPSGWLDGSIRYVCIRLKIVRDRIMKFDVWNK